MDHTGRGVFVLWIMCVRSTNVHERRHVCAFVPLSPVREYAVWGVERSGRASIGAPSGVGLEVGTGLLNARWVIESSGRLM